MFTVPALVSIASDVLVVYIHRGVASEYNAEQDGFDKIRSAYYITSVSCIRMLLLLPLYYHNVTGSRLKSPILYHILHVGSLLFIFPYMISISVNSFLAPTYELWSFSQAASLSITNRVWIMLWLSTISIVLHWIILYHLRCTAPPDINKRKRQLMAYAACNRLVDSMDKIELASTFNETDISESCSEESSLECLLPDEFRPPASPLRQIAVSGQLHCLESHHDFFTELQDRMMVAKFHWTEKLEEFTQKLQKPGPRSSNPLQHYFQSQTPFHVILRLFAYEEVLTNKKLDAVFEVDDGKALTFYIPQLLSFLLHGAFLNSVELEQWVLEKCENNFYFAHCCFWFLKAWCLSGTELNMEEALHKNDLSFMMPTNKYGKLTRENLPMEGRKYPDEERRVIQALLERVTECGQFAIQMPDQLVQFADSANSKTDLFLSTPCFLDALCKIADKLFLAPREERTNELRRNLLYLEGEMLSSKNIYIPLSNTYNHVCGILAAESIAISTKERVPCIITLEVIDYQITQKKDSMVLDKWIKGERWCRRHEGILKKVQHYTHRELKKFTERDGNIIEIIGGFLDHHNDGDLENGSMVREADDQSTSSRNMTSSPLLGPLSKEEKKIGKNPSDSLEMTSSACSPERKLSSVDLDMGQWSSKKKKKRLSETLFEDSNNLRQELSSNASSIYQNTSGFSEYKTESHYYTSPPNPLPVPEVVFKESWDNKTERLRAQSQYGSHPGWRLFPVLIKSNDDLRQEQLASQLIHQSAQILAKANVPVWLYPYEILALSDRAGIIEAIPDTISLDSLKKNDETFSSLSTFFRKQFGPEECDAYLNARANFVESLAAYSIVTYLLQIKDRHNGNILLDNKGHLIHIDFGFFFLSSPGKNSGFESAPFKLSRDFVDLMGGPSSRSFAKFRSLCLKSFLELRKHYDRITLLVEMLTEGNEDLACFCGSPDKAVQELKARFKLDSSDRACHEYVNGLIDESLENWRTRWYDRYQRFCGGVL